MLLSQYTKNKLSVILQDIREHQELLDMTMFDVVKFPCGQEECHCGTPGCLGGFILRRVTLEHESPSVISTTLERSVLASKWLGIPVTVGVSLFYCSSSVWTVYQEELGLDEVCLDVLTAAHVMTMLENLISGKWELFTPEEYLRWLGRTKS